MNKDISSRNHSKEVKRYYENNTGKFLRFGSTAATKSIHQPLWKLPTFTKEEAVYYANELIIQIIEKYPEKEDICIIDLGCGVGSSLFYLADRLGEKAIYYGISISKIQIDIAEKERIRRVAELSQPTQFNFLEADFTALPPSLPAIDIAFSIEAFVHASSAEKYFEQISQFVKKGSRLVLIDDFLNDRIDLETLDQKSQKAIADFKYGWMVNSLHTKEVVSKMAARFGWALIASEDLTPYMRNNTWKHKWIGLLVVSFRWLYDLLPNKSTYFRSWIGGKGKQYCLRKGIVQYQQLVFEKKDR